MSFSVVLSCIHIERVEVVMDSRPIIAPGVRSIYFTFPFLQTHTDKDWDKTFLRPPGLKKMTMQADEPGSRAHTTPSSQNSQESSLESVADHAMQRLPDPSDWAAERAVNMPEG